MRGLICSINIGAFDPGLLLEKTVVLSELGIHPIVRKIPGLHVAHVLSHSCLVGAQPHEGLFGKLLAYYGNSAHIGDDDVAGVDHYAAATDRVIEFARPAMERAKWGYAARVNRETGFDETGEITD